jgi:hypothetical protein
MPTRSIGTISFSHASQDAPRPGSTRNYLNAQNPGKKNRESTLTRT